MSASVSTYASSSTFSKSVAIAVLLLLLFLLSISAGVVVVVKRSSSSSDLGFGFFRSMAADLTRFRSDSSHRKLLGPNECYYSSPSSRFNRSSGPSLSLGGGERKLYKPFRAWGQDECDRSDIVINQGPSSPLPNGIPTYSVEILNVCSYGCDIAGIHVKCGKFSSASGINPEVFKRLDYDDCLVNGGRRLENGMSLSFEYANTYPYPMDVIDYVCC